MQYDQHSTSQAYIEQCNEDNRTVSVIVCAIILLAQIVFSVWDISTFGLNHPEMLSIVLYRHLIGDPLLFLTSYQCLFNQKSFRLDRWVTLTLLFTCASILVMYGLMYDINFSPKIEGILVVIVATLFLPNLFYPQKLLVCAFAIIGYLVVLTMHDQPASRLVHAAIYLSLITIAGTIHSATFDRRGRWNFEKTSRLNDLAHRDQLTGAENRHQFDENFQALLNEAESENQSIAMAIIDIDHFKVFNDVNGHLIGDQCLTQVAKALLDLREHKHDRCIRFGGEEFIFIKYGLPKEALKAWANNIPTTIQGLHIPCSASNREKYVTASAGISFWQPGSKITRTELMSQADKALYQAKAQGRNQAVLWQDYH